MEKLKQKSNPPKHEDILDQQFWCSLVWYARKPGILKGIAEHMFDDNLEWVGELEGEPLHQTAFFKGLTHDRKELRGYENHDLEAICRSIKSIQISQSDFLPDGNKKDIDGDWQHGFNSGCLAILREIDLRQEKEENPDVEYAFMDFPNLDS
jgi:hypothetical protein